jgi:hypothetical protein
VHDGLLSFHRPSSHFQGPLPCGLRQHDRGLDLPLGNAPVAPQKPFGFTP